MDDYVCLFSIIIAYKIENKRILLFNYFPHFILFV
jgi:hypothetical protein